jgi:hypothetical protein
MQILCSTNNVKRTFFCQLVFLYFIVFFCVFDDVSYIHIFETSKLSSCHIIQKQKIIIFLDNMFYFWVLVRFISALLSLCVRNHSILICFRVNKYSFSASNETLLTHFIYIMNIKLIFKHKSKASAKLKGIL